MKNKNIKDIFTIGRYFKNKFGEKIYKVPISISGFTCPNIDGTVAKGGCTFCENDSFSPNTEKTNGFKLHPNDTTNPNLGKQLLQLQTQFDNTSDILRNKFGAKKFLVYFQSFTNTYAPFDTIKSLYEKALSFENVVGLSIGTRTDSITNEILDYLVELNNRKIPTKYTTKEFKNDTYEIWLEYGIQTIYNETLTKINRGHTIENVIEWITKTKAKGLLVCGHMIFGLPDETQDMMLKGVKKAIELQIDSIKFHPLYVVKKTLLTQTFLDGKFTPITEELYINTLVKSIKILPENISIQRVTAGISDDSLLAPMWCSDKHKQMYNIKQALLKENLNY
jgi:radical SAM protein (TIGR01212 family)